MRLYQPKGERLSDGVVIFIHGGGFVIGETGTFRRAVFNASRFLIFQSVTTTLLGS